MTSRTGSGAPAKPETEKAANTKGAAAQAMPRDEEAMWEKAAEDLQPPKILIRIHEHQKFVVATTTTVGTLLAGLGGVTAAITSARTIPSLNGIPLVPAGALLVSALAGLAVAVSLIARRPNFSTVNTHNTIKVRDHIISEIDRNKNTLKLSSGLLLAAAITAVATSIVAGLSAATADRGPRNLASLSSTVGEEGATSVTLAGSVDRLQEDQHVTVRITSPDTAGPLADLTVHPDADGKATLEAAVHAPAQSKTATATITVREGTSTVRTYTLSATYPPVPSGKPSPTASASS